ncbi:unnamed protein product, partial [marine sediment metagenome]
MIFQGLFNILDLYLNEIDLFYNNIDKYFREKISNFIEEKSFKYEDLNKELKEILLFLTNEFYELGFEREEIEKKFSDQFLFIMKNEMDSLTTPIKRYEKKIAPIIFEIFLEKIVDYIVDDTCVPLMLKLKSKEILSIEFVIE